MQNSDRRRKRTWLGKQRSCAGARVCLMEMSKKEPRIHRGKKDMKNLLTTVGLVRDTRHDKSGKLDYFLFARDTGASLMERCGD